MSDEERRNQYNLSRATKRLKRDLNLILTEPIPSIHVLPNEDDILDWHFVIQGRVNTPYENGMYYGRLVFPPNFPFGPPKILFLTPNGRFKVNGRMGFSLSDLHPEEWKPAYSATAVLRGVYDFMHETTETIGSIETNDCVRKQLAIDSKRYNNNNDTFRRMFPDLFDNEMVEDAFPVNESEMSLSDEFHPIHTATDEYQMDTNFARSPPSPTPGLVNDNTTQGLLNIIDDSQHRANIEYSNPNFTINGNSTPVDYTILTQVPTVSPEIPHEQVTKRSKYISRMTGNSQIKRTLSPQNDINLSKRSKYSPRVGRKSHNKTYSSRSRNFQGPLPVARHISPGVTTSEINCYYLALLLIAFLFAIGLLYLLAVLTITLK